MTIFDYVAFGAMAIVAVAIVYGVILLGDLPAKLARERNHPQVAAVQALSWFGLLFTGGILWIFAVVWAYYDYSAAGAKDSTSTVQSELAGLRERVEALESALAGAEETT